MYRVVYLFLVIFALCTEAAAQPTGELVRKLQRVLRNGCGEWIARDGILGPETREAYRRCQESYGFSPVDSVGRTGEIEAFIQELRNRKQALILLHQLGHLRDRYGLSSRAVIEDALRQVSIDLGIDPPLGLSSGDLRRLYRQYTQHPPAGSLAAVLRDNRLPFTGLEIYIQVFKKEEKLRVFARPDGRDMAFVPLKVFSVTGSPFTYTPDGTPRMAGPKTVEGDGKVPEGYYKLTWQNEWSDFYLGYQLSYPDSADRARKEHWNGGADSGGDIVLHGRTATVGCIPVGDPAIEEIYLLLNRNWGRDRGFGRIHIFPCRFDVEENEYILQYYECMRPELRDFWDGLRPVYRYFEEHRRVPEVGFDPETGNYTLPDGGTGDVGDRCYAWPGQYDSTQALARRIPVPDEYERVGASSETFAAWLRHLPLKRGRPPVRLFDCRLKQNQDAHRAVVDIDVGDRDLQQCADAVIRLRAEYLYSRGDFDAIRFNFTSGDTAKFRQWIEGYRPVVDGRNHVEWCRSANVDSSYTSFREYLDSVFVYAGSLSLAKELRQVDATQMRTGDVFIQGGLPGHAVLVVDMAVNRQTGKKLFLLAQS